MPVDFSRTGDIIEVTIRDSSGAKIRTIRCPIQDRKRVAIMMSELRNKYGFEPEINNSNSINSKQQKEKEIKDEINWLGYTD